MKILVTQIEDVKKFKAFATNTNEQDKRKRWYILYVTLDFYSLQQNYSKYSICHLFLVKVPAT